MKNKVLCLFLLASFSIKAGIYEDTMKNLVDSPGTPIYQADIKTDLGDDVGYNITTPGKYYLNQDIEGDAENTTAIIQISTSGVCLDLNNKVINSTNVVTTGAISVADTAEKNITIKNGVIDGKGQANLAINFNSSVNRYQSIIIDNIQVTSCSYGFLLQSISSGFIKNCILNQVGRALQYRDCTNIITRNVLANNNSSYGFYLGDAYCIGLIFEDCVAKDIGHHGFGLFDANHCIFRNCEASSCGNSGFFIRKVSIDNGFNTFIKCLAKNCTWNGFQSDLILFNVFIDCESKQNTTEGFLFNIGKQVCLGCEASSNGANGFYITQPGVASYAVFKNCLTSNNVIDGFSIKTLGNVIVNCHAQNDYCGFYQNTSGDNLFIYNLALASTNDYSNITNATVGNTGQATGENLRQ